MSKTRHVWKAFLTGLLLILSCSFGAAADQTIEFSWAVLRDTSEGQQAIDFLQPKNLPEGTKLQIFLEQNSGVFIYLYLIDSSGTLTLLYPEKADYYEQKKPVDKVFRIPPGAARFTVTSPSGQEKLYLMASTSRFERLEHLTAEYTGRPIAKRNHAAILQEMKKIKRRFSSLAQVTEVSIPVAGTVRSAGREKEENFKVTKVTADSFYSRILVIHHE